MKSELKYIAIGLLAGLALGGFIAYTSAAFNEQINYQGKLANSAGVAVADGTYCMKFVIYDALTEGSALWSEEWEEVSGKVTVASGLFSVMLGSHTSISSVDFNNASRYLEVQLDPDCDDVYEEVFAPRKQMGAVPAAFEAKQLGGNTWAVPGTIGSTTPNTGAFTTLNASGTATVGQLIDSGLTASKPVFTDGDKQLTSSGTLGADQGGTGLSSLTAYAVLAGGTTSTGNLQQVSGLGDSGQVLTSNGAGVLPTWQAAAAGISFGSTTQIPYTNVAGNDFLYTAALTYSAGTLSVGAAGTATGALNLLGTTSGTAEITTDGTNGDIIFTPGSVGNPALLSDTGVLILGGYGNTNNENLTIDFETTANVASFSTTTGVTAINFNALDITTTGTVSAGDASITGTATVGSLSGLIKGTAGVLSAITDNSSNWDAAYTHKTTEDAISGLVFVNGAGSYSAKAIGTDVQAYDAELAGLAALSYSSGTPFVKMTAAGTFSLDTSTYLTSLSGALLANGTVPLTADWNMGAFDLTGGVDATFSGQGSFGSLLVDTTTLVVNASGYTDRVGIGTATPNNKLQVAGLISFDDTLYNVALGTTALNAITSGSNNFGIGYEAGLNITSSSNNFAIGYRALKNVQTSASNFAIGNNALILLGNTGDANFAIGNDALTSLASGYRNFALGRAASYYANGLSDNMALGSYALFRQTGGSQTMGVGENAFFNVLNSTNSVAIGYSAGQGVVNSTANYDVFIGHKSGFSLDGTAQYDVGIGYQSLYSLTSGDDNTAIGALAGFGVSSGSSNVLIGFSAGRYLTTESNVFLVNNQNQGSSVADLTDSLLYGTFNATVASQQLTINAGAVYLPYDNEKLYFGSGNDASIYYDATNLVINPKEVGSGYLSILGDVNITGTLTYSGSDPMWETFYPASKQDVLDNVQMSTPPDKWGGVTLFYNKDRGELEVYSHQDNQIYRVVMQAIESTGELSSLYYESSGKELKLGNEKLDEKGAAGEGKVEGVEISSPIIDKIKDIVAGLGISVKDGVTSIASLATKDFSADNAKIAVADIQKMQMTDDATDDIYCIWISNGEWKKEKGDCASLEQEENPPQETTEEISESVSEEPPVQEESPVNEPSLEEPAEEPEPTEEIPAEPEQPNAPQVSEAFETPEQVTDLSDITESVSPSDLPVVVSAEDGQPVIETPSVEPEPPAEVEEQPQEDIIMPAAEMIQEAAAGLLKGVLEFIKNLFGLMGEKIIALGAGSANLAKAFQNLAIFDLFKR